ncbi:MAG TPA: TRAP transporter small permease [Geminicoccaceae bacterium]|nr:TRAP transporter small permease [Geminicoccaceae bacterium]
MPIRLEEALAAAAMALICLISFANTALRYLTDVSFAFTEEFSVFLLVFMTFTGAAVAFATDTNIRIAWLEQRLGPAGRRLLDLLSIAATTLVLALVIWHGSRLTLDQWRWEETSPGLGYPQWLYTVWLPLLALVCLFRAWGWALRRLGGGA